MIPSPQTTPSSTLLLLANEQKSKLPITNRMASRSKRQLLCNGESANSYLFCKTHRNRRFVDTQFKRPISKAQFAMSAKSRLFWRGKDSLAISWSDGQKDSTQDVLFFYTVHSVSDNLVIQTWLSMYALVIRVDYSILFLNVSFYTDENLKYNI